jgi:integral membrane sensor domain MASE1
MVSRSLVPNSGSVSKRFQAFGRTLARDIAPANLATLFALTTVYFITGKFGQQLAAPNPDATAFWPPTGISLAAVLLRGNRVWPAIFVGAFLVNMTSTHSIPTSLAIAVINTLEALAGAYLVKKFANGNNAFYEAPNVLRFALLAGVIPTALCAIVGASLLCHGGFARWTDFWSVWPVWWVGDLVAALLLTPFLVLLFGHRHHSLSLAELLEATLLLTGLSLVCVLNFGPLAAPWIPKAGLLYLCLPFLVWSALRFCPLEAAGTTLLMSGFAMWGSLHGYGPYGNTTGAPMFVVGYVAVASIMTMTIAAVSARQRKQTSELLELYYTLEETKRGEIRLLQDTVDSLQVEISENQAREKHLDGRN